MKRTMIAAVALGLFTASTIAGTAALPRSVRAEEGDAGNRTLYQETFDGMEENSTVGSNFKVSNGEIEATDNANFTFPVGTSPFSKYVYNWTVSMDITFPEVSSGEGYIGLNVIGLAENITYEFTIGKGVGTNATNFIKHTGDIVDANSSDAGQGGNPVISSGTTYNYAVEKIGETFTAFVNGEMTVSHTIEGADKIATGMNVYTFNLNGAKVDNIKIEKNTVDLAMEIGEVAYSQDFEAMEAGDMCGDFTVTEDKQITSEDDNFKAVQLDTSIVFPEDWLLKADVTMPNDKAGFFGFNLYGLQPDTTYEFTMEQKFGEAFSIIKKHITPALSDPTIYNSFLTDSLVHSMPGNLTYEIGVMKVGKMFSMTLDGRILMTVELSEVQSTASGFNIYCTGLGGIKIDNVQLLQVSSVVPVESVTLTSDKPSISTMQSATIRAEVLPATAKIESVEWEVDDEVVENSGTTFAFSSQDVGEHTIVCTVNGVASAPLTVNVTEPSEDEKNSLFYENFDALPDGTQWGSFTVQNGAAHTNKDYNRYDVVFDFERDFEVTFDVTWNDDITIDSYVGFVVQGLTETAAEVEFNFHRVPVSEEEGAPVSNVVVKYNGTERYFSNDPEKGGRLDSLTFETGTTYTYRFVRYNDQFEIYVNDQLAVKYYMKDANSDPTVPTGMFLYTYNESAVPVTIDNFVIRAAEEITDRVEPPVVEVTSAYVTASSVIIGAGESTTLTAQATPFDATVTSYQWYLDGTAISGATEKNYVFTAGEKGEYTFKCLINGTVESESKTITVNAPQGGGDTQTPAETPDHTGLIVGLSVGGVVVVAAAGAVIWLIIRKRRKQG